MNKRIAFTAAVRDFESEIINSTSENDVKVEQLEGGRRLIRELQRKGIISAAIADDLRTHIHLALHRDRLH